MQADLIGEEAERAFAFQKRACLLFGPAAGLMLRELVFWWGKRHDEDPGVYRTMDEWATAQGLTEWYVKKARKKLKCEGLLEWKVKGVPRRTYYYPNLPAIMEAMYPQTEETGETDDRGETDVHHMNAQKSTEPADSKRSASTPDRNGTLAHRLETECKDTESKRHARVADYTDSTQIGTSEETTERTTECVAADAAHARTFLRDEGKTDAGDTPRDIVATAVDDSPPDDLRATPRDDGASSADDDEAFARGVVAVLDKVLRDSGFGPLYPGQRIRYVADTRRLLSERDREFVNRVFIHIAERWGAGKCVNMQIDDAVEDVLNNRDAYGERDRDSEARDHSARRRREDDHEPPPLRCTSEVLGWTDPPPNPLADIPEEYRV